MFFPHNSLVSLAETEAWSNEPDGVGFGLVVPMEGDAQARDRKVGDLQPGLSYV